MLTRNQKILTGTVFGGLGAALAVYWYKQRKAKALPASIPQGTVEVTESAYVEADGQCFYVGDGSGAIVDMSLCNANNEGQATTEFGRALQAAADKLTSWLR